MADTLYTDRLERYAQGEATVATPEEIAKEKTYTNPRLHRRTDPHQPDNPQEVVPREYTISTYGLDAYLTTKKTTHVEEGDPEFQETDEDGNPIGEREIP